MNRRAAAILAILTTLGACSGGGDSPSTTGRPEGVPAPRPTTTTEPRATTTTAPPTSTSVAEVAAADIVYLNGDVITMESDLGTTQAIAILGDTIAALGTTDEIRAYVGPHTTVVDLDGRAVIPGFVDPHTHILTDMGGIEVGQELALASGITSLGDASVEEGLAEEFVAASASGALRIRTSLYLARTDPCGTDFGRWYTHLAPGAQLADRVRVGGVKIFGDGGVCGVVASSQPFLDGVAVGEPYFAVDDLATMIAEEHRDGYQVVVHAQGDLAIDGALEAYDKVLDGSPNDLRHRIDHNVFVTPEIASRYADIGIIPAVFGVSAACTADAAWTDFYRELGDRPNAFAGEPDVRVTWHGDDPSLPPVSPILELFSMVTRAAVAEDGTVCDAPGWMAGDGVEIGQGLAMMTIDSAHALNQDEIIGSLKPGKLADLAVLSANLLEVDSEELPEITVLATVIGGVTEYCAPEAGTFCPDLVRSDGPTASASSSRSDHGPELVLDGNARGDSFWSSGADLEQWIKVDLPAPSTVSEVRFVVFQNPPSHTVHDLDILVDDEWTRVHSFSGLTATGDVLTWRPDVATEGVAALRMTTKESLSWPEWYEIEVDYTTP